MIRHKSIEYQLIEDLKNLGIREDGILLVHSSLKALGDFPDKAETLITALLDTVGTNGTVLIPALSYATVGKENPFFDVRKTPSCVGALTEYFRLRKGTLRSMNPTHSICGAGRQADFLLSYHQKDKTPCGPNSPLRKLHELNGQILFIGCGLKPNTSMHAIEELSEPPYLFGEEILYTVTSGNGEKMKMKIRRHNFHGWVQRYDRLEQLLSREELRKGRILEAPGYLVEVRPMWEKAHDKLKEEPCYFVEEKKQ